MCSFKICIGPAIVWCWYCVLCVFQNCCLHFTLVTKSSLNCNSQHRGVSHRAQSGISFMYMDLRRFLPNIRFKQIKSQCLLLNPCTLNWMKHNNLNCKTNCLRGITPCFAIIVLLTYCNTSDFTKCQYGENWSI